MAVDDFESAFEEALAAETLEPSETLGTDRNATIHQGDEELTADDGLALSDDIGELEAVEDDAADMSVTEEFDWQGHKDRLVKVKVDGEEIVIPLAEAMSSYMRQADYTKKTQALAEDKRMAEWAREMRSAIQNDPAGTVQALQRALGLESESEESDLYADLDPELQPMVAQMQAQQRQIDQFQQMMAQQREAQVFSEVQAEVASVRAKYADFDATKVLPLAAERGLTILEAYKLVKADEFLNQEDRQAAAQATAAAKAAAAAQKKAAADKVARGGSASGTAQEQIAGDTFAEMLEHRLQLANS